MLDGFLLPKSFTESNIGLKNWFKIKVILYQTPGLSATNITDPHVHCCQQPIVYGDGQHDGDLLQYLQAAVGNQGSLTWQPEKFLTFPKWLPVLIKITYVLALALALY